MGCNCKVKQKVGYIQAKYGTKDRGEKKKTTFNLSLAVKNLGMSLLVIIFLPIIIIVTFIWGLFSRKKTINISKLFHL